MRAVNADDVLKILYKYGKYIFVTDEKKYSDMVDEIANIKALEQEPIIDKIKSDIVEEKEWAYADFERYKVEYLGQDWEDVYDSLPQDDFRYGMERCLEIIDKYMGEE